MVGDRRGLWEINNVGGLSSASVRTFRMPPGPGQGRGDDARLKYF